MTKFAIVDKTKSFKDYNGVTGRYVYEVSDNQFDINTATIEWIECPDDVINPGDWFYTNNGFVKYARKPYIDPKTGIEHPWDWKDPTAS